MSEDTSPRRASRTLLVEPSSPKSDNGAIELAPIQEGTPAVLKFGEEPDVIVQPNKISETAEKPKKKKKWWQKKEVDENAPKPVNIIKLFRYATWFDLILLSLSMFFAICHGVALPGSMYIFGDLTNFFVNHNITQQIFMNINNGISDIYVNVDFNDSASFASVVEAFDNGAVSPNVLNTTNNLTEYFTLFFINDQNSSNLTIEELIRINVSACVVSNNAMDAGVSIYNYLNNNIEDNTLSITASSSACDQCLDDLFEEFSAQARCLSNDDFLFGEGGTDGILWQIYIFIMISVAVFVCGYFQISLIQLACERQVHKIRQLYYKSVLRQEVGWFDLNPSGELASRLNDDIDKIHDGIGDKLAILVQWLFTFIAGFVIGFVRDWRLTLFLLGAVTPFLIVSAAIFSSLAASFTSKEQKLYASAGAIAEEVLSSVRTVVAFGGEYHEVDRYEKKLGDAYKLGLKKGTSTGLSLAAIYLIIFTCYAAAFWFGGFLIQEEILQTGDFLTVFFAVIIGAFSLGQAAPNAESLFTAMGSAGAVYETIDRVPEIDASADEGEVLDTFEPSIKFEDVCFTYPARPDVQVLNNLNLEVKVGQTVALVGSSGCGKSTVTQLIQRFYNYSSGLITISGRNITDLNIRWLRSNIGVVSQEPVLFDTTIAENIRYGKEGVTMEQIEAAAKNANAHDFISELPDGYNTLVGDRGTQLSGGQKQRVAIARALVRDPKLLLLDEATSALDTESERIVQEALDRAREGRTTIVIAHRLSTIKTADVIVSIDKGHAVEFGTHGELMKLEGLYCELVNAQTYGDEAYEVDVQRQTSRILQRARSRHTPEREDAPKTRASIRIKRQGSKPGGEEVVLNTKDLEKLEKEWDKDIPEVSLLRVMKANAKEWWLILLGLLGSLILGLIYPAFAIFFGEIFEVFARPANEILDGLHLWAGLFIVLGAVSGVGVFLKSVCFGAAGESLTSRLRVWSFKAMLRQEMGWFDEERNSSGVLATRLSQDASRVHGATGTRLGTLLETGFSLIASLIIALIYSWVLTLVLLTLVPVLMIGGFLQLKALTGHAGETKKALEQAGKIAIDSFDNVRTVASLGIEPNFYDRYNVEIKKPYRRSLINSFVYGLTYGFSQSILFFGYVLTFGFGAYQVTRNTDDIAYASFADIFVVFSAVIFGAVGAGQASSFAPNYAQAKVSANRIYALLDREPVIDSYSEDGAKPDKISTDMEFVEVGFNYPSRPDVQVLKGLSVTVKPGQTLALVGPSGCGKSTVVSLLERFYDPLSGSIKIDNTDTRDYNIRWLRSQIGIVSQEPVLFDTSVADNIRYGDNTRQVSDEEVVEAAKAANIHSFIESLPQGYETNVGSRGTQLSGGQKQRIAIARALVRDPKILLLDEATSALDTESERIVQEALDKAREGRTTIVIAHRLSTIYNSDAIAVISNGVVAEIGTHSELLQQHGIYYRLNQNQIKKHTGERERSESASFTMDDSIVN